LVGLQLVFYWLHMVNDPHCSPTRKEALKQAGSQLKEIMQGCSGWDALKKFPGWEPVTQSDLRLLIHVLIASIDDQLQTTDSANLMSHLFRGVKRSFVKCVDIDEESSEVEGFCEIELNAKESADGTKDLMTVGHPSSVVPFFLFFFLLLFAGLLSPQTLAWVPVAVGRLRHRSVTPSPLVAPFATSRARLCETLTLLASGCAVTHHVHSHNACDTTSNLHAICHTSFGTSTPSRRSVS
jgi:hypothetical protein